MSAPVPPNAYAARPAAPKPPTWWQRNWKWFLPVGCLGLLLVFLAFGAAVTLLVFRAIQSTEPAQYARIRAQRDTRVIAALGQPVEQGLWISGNVSSDAASGAAELALPISGPRGEATVYVVARKTAGRWEYSVLEVEVDGSPVRIDLLQAAPLRGPPPN